MATVIDALVVTLGLDAKNFNDGRRQVSEGQKRFANEMERDTKRASQSMNQVAQGYRRIRNEVVGLIALTLGAGSAGSLIANTVGDQAQLGRLSTDLKMSARELDAWGRVMTSVGGRAEDARQSMLGVMQQIQSFALGNNSETVAILRSMNINIADDQGQIRAPQDILMDVSREFGGMSPSEQRYVSGQLGLSESLLQIMREGPESLQNRYSQAYRASNVTEGSTEAAQQAQLAFSELSNEIRGVWQTIFVSAIPAMGDLNEIVGEFGDWLNANRGSVAGFFDELIDLGEDAIRVGRGLRSNIDPIREFFNDISDLANYLIDLTGGSEGWLSQAAGMTAFDLWDQSKAMLGFGGDDDDSRRPEPRTDAPEERMDYVISYLMRSGWTREQAVGIAANLQHESALDPTAVGDGGLAYGVAQWHPDRQENFRKWAGHSIQESSLEDQLDFINYEMLAGQEVRAGQRVRSARTARQAADAVSRYYERPADTEGEARRRANTASGLYRETRDVVPLGSRANSAVNTGANTINNSQSEVSIGQINIQTQATDAAGISRDISESMRQNQLINAATTGMA